ncbi:hypothetical protein [Mesorhizobium sp.]|uniref:hypothetical protein n=1 Tax=Mesorhizobium sp. TaxID=1871066 RepID=UPI0011F696B8|nr:hypothetical protein [Mesorhizobium sp.]TIV59101.1 MAG: hypothetical protein E5V80_15495 [Mesorhizobium sp.]
MDAEAEYYRELRSQTKIQLLAEIRSLRKQIDEREEGDRAEKQRIEAGHAANKAYLEKKTSIRLAVAFFALVAFGIGYAFYPGLLAVMAFVFVLYLFLPLVAEN